MKENKKRGGHLFKVTFLDGGSPLYLNLPKRSFAAAEEAASPKNEPDAGISKIEYLGKCL